MTITQLLKMPVDKEKSKCGGFQLTIKTARSNRKVDGRTVQQVCLSDSSGEMPGDIFMPNPKQCSYLPRATVINVIICWLQPGEDGPKLYVEQWYLPKCDAEGNPVYRNNRRNFDDLPSDFCEGDENIPSMCRNSQTRNFIGGYVSKTGKMPECNDENKDLLNEWVEFVLTGK